MAYRGQIDKPVEDLSRRLRLYAEILAAGSKTLKAAAIEAGFSPGVAASGAYAWIGKTREASQYPQLFDYYTKLRAERLRHFEITEDMLSKELRTIAMASIEDFLDLPKKAVHTKAQKMREQLEKLYTRLDDYKIERAPIMTENGPLAQVEYMPQAKPLLEKIKKLQKQLTAIEAGPGFSIRLKYLEEIPAELMPAIAEIRETREGIHVKLHPKLDAIEKLGRWLNMFSAEKALDPDKVDPGKIVAINFNVKGSQSQMEVNPKDKVA